jgi:hypothetical protein
MQQRSDDQIRKECESLGEAAVEAGLKTGRFPDNPAAAHEWLIQRRMESNHRRMQVEIGYTRKAVYASWVLAAISLVGVFWQSKDASEQRELMKSQLEHQQKDSQAQRVDAKALLAVQISVEFDKKFDSREMRQARRRLSAQLLNHKEVTDTRVLDFFDQLGMYADQGRVDKDTVYRSYSYWIERYWPVLKKAYVDDLRREKNDADYYADFEELYEAMKADDDKGSGKSAVPMPSKSDIHKFLVEESTLQL